MKTVEFKFEVDQKVKVTTLNIVGVVDTCAYSDAGITYYISTAQGGGWYNERHLTSAHGDA